MQEIFVQAGRHYEPQSLRGFINPKRTRRQHQWTLRTSPSKSERHSLRGTEGVVVELETLL